VSASDQCVDRANILADAPLLLGVREGYEQWAPNYDQSPNPLVAREKRYLDLLLPQLRGKKVLDLACGTGRWLESAQAGGAEFAAGVDSSNAMLRIAAGKCSVQGKLAQADCMRLPFRPSVFDFSICSFAVGHIQDLRTMAHELASVMKPGGEVTTSDVHPEAYARGWRTGFRDVHRALQIQVFPRTAEEIVQAFYSGGFECLTYTSLCLGEPERPIFIRANREHAFQEACRIPAVLVCRFKLRNPASREAR
jgi:ubiquinone/menaquinone biosynthesis C-methylase UbiE